MVKSYDSPYERVEDNIKQAAGKANVIIDSIYPGKEKDLVDWSHESSSQQVEKGDILEFLDSKNYNPNKYSEAIKNLSIKKDLRSNINTYISDNEDGTKTLVRDARAAIDPPIIAPESYELLAINHARAAIQVLEDDFNRGEIDKRDKNQAIEAIHANMIDFVKEAERDFADISASILSIEIQNDKKNKESEISQLEKKLKKFNKNLVDLIENAGVDKAEGKIKLAKDFANFDDENYHIATITNLNGHSIVEIEAMNLGLTKKQKEMFEAVKNCQLPEGRAKMNILGENMEWFNNQPRYVQDMIKNSAEKILTKNKVIPTQLRGEIPLLRNSYTKSTQVQKANEKSLVEVHRLTHSGTVTIAIPDTSKTYAIGSFFGLTNKDKAEKNLANENIEQLKQFSNNGKVSLEILTSPNNPFTSVDVSDKNKISNNPENGVYKSITAFNGFRRLAGSRRLAGYNSIIAEVERQGLREDSEGCKALLEAKKLMNKSSLTTKYEDNLNQQIAEKMSEACYLLKKEGYKNIPDPNISCASGKDRTQMTIIGATCSRIADYLGEATTNISSTLGRSGSAQYLSGGNGGGTIGCHGQKPETAKEARKNLFSLSFKFFGQRTADLNKFKVSSWVKKRIKSISKLFSKKEDKITKKGYEVVVNNPLHEIEKNQRNIDITSTKKTTVRSNSNKFPPDQVMDKVEEVISEFKDNHKHKAQNTSIRRSQKTNSIRVK